MIVNTGEARNRLSELLNLLEEKKENEIIIANRGVPVARLVLYSNCIKRELGLAKGKFDIPDDIDSCNDKVAEMFGVGV